MVESAFLTSKDAIAQFERDHNRPPDGTLGAKDTKLLYDTFNQATKLLHDNGGVLAQGMHHAPSSKFFGKTTQAALQQF